MLLATRVAAAEPGPEPDSAGLVAEGERQHQAHADDQALANFLAAYARAPSPAILLRIADVLHDMSRFADVANTYQRFLLDPASAGDPSAPRVQQELAQLDAQLTVLTVRVFPRGSAISLDGGPFVPVGGALITRVRPGLHLVRIRAADPAAADPAPHELTVNGSEGEAKDVVATLPGAPATPPPPVAHGAPAVPERAYGWLITGTQYATDDPTGRARTVRARDDGRPLAALVP
ncbi:MAG TPA: hypothetical protein VFP84_03640, partial [Kofleriaceae bacterium]|nr:hypothetical protein [Kofleriaceae bacterium]